VIDYEFIQISLIVKQAIFCLCQSSSVPFL